MTDVSKLGMGVVLGMLGGNEETITAIKGAIGKEIASAKLDNDELRFEFADGSKLKLWDGGQSCCESRYMRTDDDLPYYTGAVLQDFEIREAPPVPAEYDAHDVQFLAVKTSKGEFVMSNHNEHNGYYGGFWIRASS